MQYVQRISNSSFELKISIRQLFVYFSIKFVFNTIYICKEIIDFKYENNMFEFLYQYSVGLPPECMAICIFRMSDVKYNAEFN